jgi:hypothetical protein
MFTRAHQVSLFWARSNQSIPTHPISLQSILILPSNPRLCLSIGLIYTISPTKPCFCDKGVRKSLYLLIFLTNRRKNLMELTFSSQTSKHESLYTQIHKKGNGSTSQTKKKNLWKSIKYSVKTKHQHNTVLYQFPTSVWL